MHFFIIGFMGSGKTTIGKKLAALLNMPVIDMDEWIEEREGCSIRQIFQTIGEDQFRVIETETLDHLSGLNMNHVIICGGGTTCLKRNRVRMAQSGKIILVECNKKTLIERLIREKEQRPMIHHIVNEEMEQYIDRLLEDRKDAYSEYDYKFEIGKTDLHNFAKHITNE